MIAALDETRALSLALIEVLSEKFAGQGFEKVLSRRDVEVVFQKQVAMVERFRKEREERARGLVLPPGAKA